MEFVTSSDPDPEGRRPPSGELAGFLRLAIAVLSWGWFYWVAFDSAVHGQAFRSMMSTLFVFPLIVMWLGPVFYEKAWFLVPGGLVCRESALWRRDSKCFLYTPRDTPLLVDMRSGLAAILGRRGPESFGCPSWIAWAVVAAWISTARTPTIDEVQTYLGCTPPPGSSR